MEFWNLILTFLIIIFSYCVYVYIKNRRYWRLINQFKGDKPLPIIGNVLEVLGTSEETFERLKKMWLDHGSSTFKLQVMNAVFLILCEREHIELILCDNTEIKKTEDYHFLKRWLGNGLLLSEGYKWRRQRKIITPAFHFKILEQFVEIFEEKGNIYIEKLAENKNKIFDVYPLTTLCTLDIISESAMGTNINAQTDSGSDYVKAVYRMTEIFFYRSLSFWKRFDFLYQFSSDYKDELKCVKILHELTDKVIQSGKKRLMNESEDTIQKSPKKKVAFLDLLLRSKTPEGESLSDEVIREEVNTFMFEGHDTTSTALSFALYSLANNPNVQNLAFEEQMSLFGNDLSINATHSQLQEMNYLDRVIKETLRMFPSVPMYGRTLMNDVKLNDGRIIPAGTFAMINALCLGNDPKYHADPEKFDPDRFLQENGMDPFNTVPFSAGPRNCIGQKFAMLEMKALLSRVLRNYELLPGGPGTEIKVIAEILLKSKNGMQIKIRDRKYP